MSIKRLKTALAKVSIFVAIKILYICLTVHVLKDLWYIGAGNYGISFNMTKACVGMVVFLVMAVLQACMPKKSTLVEALLTILFVLYYIPLISAFSINDASYDFFIKINIYYALILFFVRFFIKAPKAKNTVKDGKKDLICLAFDPPVVQFMCIAVCVFYILYKISYNGFSFSLSIAGEDVYATRDDYQESLLQMSGSLFSYIFSIVRNLADLVVPVYMYYCLTQKKLFGLMISLLSLLSIFSISSSKTTLIFVAVVLAVAIFRNTRFIADFSYWFTLGMLGFLLVCLFENLLLGSDKIFMLFIRRVMYAPAWLNSLYYEFFDENVKVMWTQDTFLLQMISSPKYPEGVLKVLSDTYFGGQMPSPNTGMFAEAYMHFGNFGIVLYPAIFTAVIAFSQKVFAKYGDTLAILIAAKLAFKLMNVPMVRTDFALSFILFTVLMSVLPRLRWRPKDIRAYMPKKNKLSVKT